MLVASIIIFVLLALLLYSRHSKFGAKPSGRRLEKIRNSPNFRNGKFQNINPTPSLTEGTSYFSVIYTFFFKRNPRRRPSGPIPSIKTNLKELDNRDLLVWFGHSSYFLQAGGRKFLIDPVFSGNASPIAGSNTSFDGTDIYTVNDLPEIDYLLLTHDHYDHADYQTLIALKSKTARVICGLGVGSHLEHWGYDPAIILEADLFEHIALDAGINLHTAPSRHFSGRGFTRNNTLWLSFMLLTAERKIYIGGDSGYDTHFSRLGDQFGPIDLAILDNGQYNKQWKYIHMMPEEVLRASGDLKAKRLFPVHSSKFAMSNHDWDEPLRLITELHNAQNAALVTPIIGELVYLDEPSQQFTQWWKTMI